ncbi:MAG: hypothetical protein QOG21_56 [Actinomycetota bacterium]|nr:hypothetical protein [Actinomycetota bacterium]
MVRRMVFRGLLISPVVIAVLAAFGGFRYGVSAAAGLAMTLLNLWLSARIIGGVAEKNPELLLPAGLATFTLGLLLLTGIALGLRATNLVYFPVTGVVLVGSHLLLVLWEAAGAYDHADQSRAATAETRS